MKKAPYRYLIVASFFLLLPRFDVSALAQDRGSPRPPRRSPEEIERQREERQKREARERLREGLESTGKSKKSPEVFWSESQLTSKERKLLETHPEDRTRYAEFLRQPGTGLFKLLPNRRYEPTGSVSVETLKSNNAILPIRGRGAYYSFSRLRHALDKWSEIRFYDGLLEVGFGDRVLGLIAAIGDTSLETLNPETRGFDYLRKLRPPILSRDAVSQSKKNKEGFMVDGLVHKSSMPPHLETTYILRSVAYHRADVLIAFRVIRQDPDGSVHILWKKLAEYGARKLDVSSKKK